MAKPWGRYEIGFLGHSKFRALNANAICLWWEVKSYCDEQLNDGRFPKNILKTFRFWSEKSVALLTASCGHKPSGETFAPLWETQDIGGVAYFQMHDYLDHNDCRDVVMARIAQADIQREKKKAYLKARREQQRTSREPVREPQIDGSRTVCEPSANQPRTVREPLANHSRTSTTPTPTQTYVPTEQERQPPPPTARSKRPVFTGQKLTVFEWMLDDLDRMLVPHTEAFRLDEWFFTLDARCVERGEIPPTRDNGEWLKAQTLAEAQRRGLPLRVVGSTERAGKLTTRLATALANIAKEAS